MILSSKTKYGDFLEYWLKVYKEPYLKPSSVKRIKAEIKNIPAYIKEKALKDITAVMVDKAISDVKLSRSRKYVYHVYRNSLKRAYCLSLIPDNVSEKIFLVKHRQKRGQALTREEQAEFIQAIKGNKYENAFLFLLYSGIRRTELVGIRFDDIHEKDGLLKINGTKTEDSERFIPYTDNLREIVERQREKAINGVIFPYYPDTLTHWFKRFCKNHKLHDLRHTYITRCAESGININVTQVLVGHRTLNTTLGIYTHVSSKFIKDEIRKLEI